MAIKVVETGGTCSTHGIVYAYSLSRQTGGEDATGKTNKSTEGSCKNGF